MDAFNLIISGWIIFIYGTSCVISVIFTLSLQLYARIEDKLNFCIFEEVLLTPLDKRFDGFNNWLMKYNKVSGSSLVFLSLLVLKLAFDVLGNL